MWMETITASEARQTLPAQLDRVEAGDEVAITRHGKIVAVLVHPEALRPRRARAAWERADDLARMLGAAGDDDRAGITADRAEELVRVVRAGRDAP